MPAVYEYLHTVLPEEIDALGHVNNLAYLKWTLSAAQAHSAAQGWAGEAYRALGAGWVVRSHQIEYLRPTFAGEEIVVRTWVASFRKVTSLRRYRILRRGDGRLLAVAATDWAFVNYATGKPTRVPPELISSFQLVEGDDPQPPAPSP